jgi:uncharacterized membrane protein
MKRSSGIIALALATAAQAQSGFHLIGTLPGVSGSRVTSLSQDGSFAAGWITRASPFGFLGFTWTASGGRNDFGLAPGMPAYSPVYGMDSTGGTIVGTIGDDYQYLRAYRRVGSGPFENLGPLLNYDQTGASAVSGDGNTVVGYALTPAGTFTIGQAFRWTSATGMQPLGFISANHDYSTAVAISRDASTILVNSGYYSFGTTIGCVWRESTGLQLLPALPGANPAYRHGSDLTADGSIIVGDAANVAGDSHAVRWTAGDIEDLGTLPQWRNSYARVINDDGSVIAGVLSGLEPETGFIWTAGTGMVTAESYLNLYGVSVPAGWRVADINALSGDGLTFAGIVQAPTGHYQGFVATVPAPAIVSLLPGLSLLRRCRRRAESVKARSAGDRRWHQEFLA